MCKSTPKAAVSSYVPHSRGDFGNCSSHNAVACLGLLLMVALPDDHGDPAKHALQGCRPDPRRRVCYFRRGALRQRRGGESWALPKFACDYRSSHADANLSEVWCGKKSSSCCLSMSTLSSSPPRYRTPRSLPTGSGERSPLISSICAVRRAHVVARRTKKKDIYVISTPMRPVPLEHFLWAGKELHRIVDSKSKWRDEG
jgi:hypothetical protein